MSQQIIVQDPRDPLGLAGRGQLPDGLETTAAIVGVIVAGAVYLLPTIVATRRRHHQVLAISMLNVLLGWSVLGWIVAMVWACTATPQDAARRALTEYAARSRRP